MIRQQYLQDFIISISEFKLNYLTSGLNLKQNTPHSMTP